MARIPVLQSGWSMKQVIYFLAFHSSWGWMGPLKDVLIVTDVRVLKYLKAAAVPTTRIGEWLKFTTHKKKRGHVHSPQQHKYPGIQIYQIGNRYSREKVCSSSELLNFSNQCSFPATAHNTTRR